MRSAPLQEHILSWGAMVQRAVTQNLVTCLMKASDAAQVSLRNALGIQGTLERKSCPANTSRLHFLHSPDAFSEKFSVLVLIVEQAGNSISCL